MTDAAPAKQPDFLIKDLEPYPARALVITPADLFMNSHDIHLDTHHSGPVTHQCGSTPWMGDGATDQSFSAPICTMIVACHMDVWWRGYHSPPKDLTVINDLRHRAGRDDDGDTQLLI